MPSRGLRQFLVTAPALLLLAGWAAQAGTILVSNEKANSITVLDADSLEIVRTVPVGQRFSTSRTTR